MKKNYICHVILNTGVLEAMPAMLRAEITPFEPDPGNTGEGSAIQVAKMDSAPCHFCI